MTHAGRDAAPAIIFLILYSAFFAVLTSLYAQRKISWRYSFVYFHVILRLGGQACGIAFAVMSWDNFDTRLNVLIAYLVLSAEGYFSLVLCTYRFLIVWQNDRLGNSVIEPRVPKGTPFLEKMKRLRKTPIAGVHWTLVAANSIIISGGSLLSSALSNETPDPNKVKSGKSMRVAGTAMFLFLVQVFACFAIHSYRKKGDRTLLLILLTWPFLTVRGVYGIISVELSEYSYYNPDVYNSDGGMSSKFLVGEYVLGTLMEWISCGLLLATYYSPLVGGETVAEGESAPDSPEVDKELNLQSTISRV
ncbi:hypothetical protein RQP46_002578 [Phenoliferia psychrophenolica]